MQSQESEIIFSSKSFDVEKVTGKDERYYAVAVNAAGIIALNEKNQLLLTREFRRKTGKIHWRIPAGKAEKGESFIDCARRELREESGFDARELEQFFEYEVLSGWYKQRKTFFVARGLFSSPLETGDEEVAPELYFLDPADVLKLLNDGEINDDVAAALYRFLHVYNLI